MRENEIYVDWKTHRILSVLAKKRARLSSDKFTIDTLAEEILKQWIENNPEAIKLRDLMERHRTEIETVLMSD